MGSIDHLKAVSLIALICLLFGYNTQPAEARLPATLQHNIRQGTVLSQLHSYASMSSQAERSTNCTNRTLMVQRDGLLQNFNKVH